MLDRSSAREIAPWAVVVAVGVAVVVLVFALGLFPRLRDGQELVDGARPAFATERVAGDRGGINMVSAIVDLVDPIATASGGGADEVSALVARVSRQARLSRAEVLAALRRRAPHATALLQAAPLSAAASELPGLMRLLARTLKTTPDRVRTLLERSFPRLARSITALPTVTSGWEKVPGTAGLTRFDGEPVRTVPELRDYLSVDVIQVLERQRGNFRRLDTGPPPLSSIPWLLLAVGVLTIAFGVVAMRSGPVRSLAVSWVVVAGVGAIVLGAVFSFQLFPALDGGQQLLDDARPAFAEKRVAGDRAGVKMISRIVDLLDPIATRSGGGAAEVPKLVALVSRRSGIPRARALAAMSRRAPHAISLLRAAPLSAATGELPRLIGFLGRALDTTPGGVSRRLVRDFPRLAQSITALPVVTGGWDEVPATGGLTRFDGRRVRTVPELRDYFTGDLIPVLERERESFHGLDGDPPLTFFPRLLLVAGLVVLAYGLGMAALYLRREPAVA